MYFLLWSVFPVFVLCIGVIKESLAWTIFYTLLTMLIKQSKNPLNFVMIHPPILLKSMTRSFFEKAQTQMHKSNNEGSNVTSGEIYSNRWDWVLDYIPHLYWIHTTPFDWFHSHIPFTFILNDGDNEEADNEMGLDDHILLQWQLCQHRLINDV